MKKINGTGSSEPAFSRTSVEFKILSELIGKHRSTAAAARLAQCLLQHFATLGKVLNADFTLLHSFDGFGQDIAREFEATRHLVSSILRCDLARQPVLERPEAAFAYCRSLLSGSPREQFHGLFLNKKGALTGSHCFQTGTVDHVTVYPREVLSRALLENACAIILVHNHPGGIAAPSSEDIVMTTHLARTCGYLGIAIVDHIIISADAEFSFRKEGLLPSSFSDCLQRPATNPDVAPFFQR
jgi:DNA repair protein RadC